MKVKGSITVEVSFDEKIRLWSAAYKNAKGQVVAGPEYGPSKTSALKALNDENPDIEFEKPPADNRDF
jgi:NAD(P)H-dependent FMN reductase